MFVNDCSKYSNNVLEWLRNPLPYREIASLLQFDVKTWEQCLCTSGGLLKLEKCLAYILHWKFNSEGFVSINKNKETEIQLTSGISHTKTVIQILDPDTLHKTLGNLMTPSLKMKGTKEKLLEIFKTFTSRILNSKLDKYKTWIAYFSVFLPKISYTFNLFSFKEDTKIYTEKSYLGYLSKIWFQPKHPQGCFFRAAKFGGLEQGIAQIIVLLQHIRTENEIG